MSVNIFSHACLIYLNARIEKTMFLRLLFNMKIESVNFKGKPGNYTIIDKYVSRSAQPQKDDFIWLKQQGVTDVINFRTMFEDKLNFKEKDVVEKLGMKYHNIPTVSSHPAVEKVYEFLDLIEQIKKSGGKAHIHCLAGADRTGLYAFIYKMKMGIGSAIENKQEWIQRGHNTTRYPKLISWAEKFVRKFYTTNIPMS